MEKVNQNFSQNKNSYPYFGLRKWSSAIVGYTSVFTLIIFVNSNNLKIELKSEICGGLLQMFLNLVILINVPQDPGS